MMMMMMMMIMMVMNDDDDDNDDDDEDGDDDDDSRSESQHLIAPQSSSDAIAEMACPSVLFGCDCRDGRVLEMKWRI
eukprot:2778792-Karenia_brevis.AAC.1